MSSADDNWVQRLRSSDQDVALEELREILVRGLSRSLAKRGGGQAFVEDITQEALVRILDSLDSFEGRSRFTTWAMAVAMRVAISELRRRHFRDQSLEQITDGSGLQFELAVDPGQSPEKLSQHEELIAQLRQLVDERLSPKQRTAIHAALNGMPVEEIAHRMHSNRNTIYKTFHDARQKLKQGLEAAGITAADVQAILS